MQPGRFSIKYFVQGDLPFDLDVLVPIFQRWIQEHTVEGILIDVADYKHVHHGPGVLLIGHEADYSIDLKGGQPGLLYTRKRELLPSLSDNLQVALRLGADAARKLEAEPTTNGVRFDSSQVVVTFLDRLNAPNTPEVYEKVQNSLREVAGSVYQTDTVSVESIEADPRKCLTVRIAVTRENVAN